MKQRWAKRALAGLAITMIGAAHAQQPAADRVVQSYPSRPVRLLMPFPAGGPTDILGRLIAQKLTEVWGQNVLVDKWNGILVPAGTPRAIINKLNAVLVKILHAPNVLDRLESDGPIPVGNSPQEFAAHIKAEQAKWSKVIREAHVRIE